MTIRIGAVSYLNTKPLIYGLEERLPNGRLSLDLPSRLATQLSDGDLDIALIPSFEAFQDPSYVVVSDACIGCFGPVWSVKLLSRVPFNQIRSLSLDEGSRTSAALSQILLMKQHQVRPQLTNWPVSAGLENVSTDAVLMIGDRAMRDQFAGFDHVVDLGEAWREWTGLPFVFATWMARSADLASKTDSAFSQARDEGVARLAEIAEQECGRYGLSSSRCLSYLRDDLSFIMGERERRALELFRELAVECELAESLYELKYYGCEAV